MTIYHYVIICGACLTSMSILPWPCLSLSSIHKIHATVYLHIKLTTSHFRYGIIELIILYIYVSVIQFTINKK